MAAVMRRCRAVMVALVAGCAGRSVVGGQSQAPKDYGVLVMAHGGKPEWNQGVLDAVKPLQREYRIEVAFGMADRTEELLSEGGACCLAFTPQINEWNGTRRVELLVVDMRAGKQAELI